jgi:Lrp/AsnC family transcriptional regulator, leucine-responsive regulatory protein
LHANSIAAVPPRGAATSLAEMLFCRIMRGMNAPKREAPKPSAKTAAMLPQAIDNLDRKILHRYQFDTRIPAAVIGDEIGLSAAAVQRRIKRLRETGVIRQEIAAIDPAAVGLAVTAIVHVDLNIESNQLIDAFKFDMCARREVQQCWYTTGLTDFVLVVCVPTMAAYEQFTRDALLSCSNVEKFTSYVALGEVKTGLSLRIQD